MTAIEAAKEELRTQGFISTTVMNLLTHAEYLFVVEAVYQEEMLSR